MSICNENLKNNAMAVQLAPLVGAGVGALQQTKINQALEGSKTFTKPKTVVGKLFGKVSGRTEAFNVQEQVKQSKIDERTMLSTQQQRQSVPVTGGISFGGQATQRTWLPFAVVGAIVAIFYAMRGKGRRRRR